jgi:hypothetical protein
MLSAALRYKEAVRRITGDVDNDLRDYELSKIEWQVLQELCDVLKVSLASVEIRLRTDSSLFTPCRFSRRQPFSSHATLRALQW